MNKRAFQKSVFQISAVILLFLFGMSGCIENSSSEKINVLVTIIPQKEMVETIGGEYITVTTMVPKGQTPHSYEPTPSQMMKVAKAKAYFIVGSGVEFEIVHLNTIKMQNIDLQIFNGSEQVDIISFNEHYGKGNQNNETNEDEHETHYYGTDPHIWTSPENYKKMVESVYKGLVEIDPSHQETFRINYEGYIRSLDQLHTNISHMLEDYKTKSFMVYHPSWGYFGDSYQLKQIVIEDEGKQPGPAGVAAIIEQAKNELITIIFVSPQYDTSSAETIANEINGTVVFADSLMRNYQETLQSLASEIVKGFQK